MRQLTSEPGKALADYIVERHKNKLRPPILWLGAGASVSAGCPATNQLIANIAENLGIEVKDLDDLDEKIIEQHKEVILKSRFSDINETSLGYSLLAELILRGYFRIVLTTNWDNILENQLHRSLAAGKINVLTRKQHTDEFIAEQLRNDESSVILVRLHGDFKGELITASEKILRFEDGLEKELERKIQSEGLVFIGYGFQEANLARVVNEKSKPKIWVADPVYPKGNVPSALGISKNQVICSEEGLFDVFLQGLCSSIMRKRLSERLFFDKDLQISRPGRKKVDHLVDGIIQKLKEDNLDEEQIYEYTKELLKKLRRYADNKAGKVALVFLTEPDSPGGGEIFKLIERAEELKRLVEQLDFVKVHIRGRREDGVRNVTSIDPKDFDLKNYESVILFDDASFSGNTLYLVRQQMEELSKTTDTDFVAALLCISEQLKEQLELSGWKVINHKFHTGFALMCPWGFTRPSQPLISKSDSIFPDHKPIELTVDSFIKSSNNSYIPKPWGELILFRENTTNSSRIISLERGQRTSLHYHLLRDEILFIMDNRVRIRLWDRYIELNKNQSIRIPAGVPHSIIALESSCTILEIAEGYYEAKRDIVRMEDIYARAREKLENGIEVDNGLV